jgi:hypothetical protein
MDREPENFDVLPFLASFCQMLQNQTPATQAELPVKLQKYSDLCDETNQRLRECHTLSLKGQYTNAVAIAEREPNLLQRCSELEIPEREILATVAQILGVAAPSLIDHALIQSLQDAYEKGSSTAANLKLLHKLTLARAPLPTRLSVMRRLLVQNPNHPFMDSDIRTFEKAWFKQAPEFARNLAKQERPELIQELIQDLDEGGYMETSPPSLRNQVESIIAKARMTLFPTLSLAIRKAYLERSLVAMASLSDRWKTLVEQAGPPHPDIQAEVDEALAWFLDASGINQREKNKEKVRSKLSLLIQSNGTTRSQLDLAYQDVVDLGALDSYLDKQYLDKLDSLENQFKAKAIMIAVAAVLTLIVGVIVAAVRFSGPSKTVTEEPVTNENETERKVEIARLEAARIEAARIEAARKEAFELAMKTLEEKQTEQDADARILAARKLAKTEEERRLLQQLVERQEKVLLSQKINKLLQSAEEMLVDARLLRAVQGASGNVDEIRSRAKELVKDSSRLNLGSKDLQRVETTLADVESFQALATRLRSLQDELKRERGSSRNLERLARFLTSDVTSVSPRSEMALQAATAQKSLPTWLNLLQLQELLRADDLPALTSTAMQWKDTPAADAIKPVVDNLRMWTERDPDGKGTVASKLKARLGEIDIVNLWVIRRHLGESENRFYSRQKPSKGGSIPCLIRPDGPEGTVVPVPLGDKPVVDRAPQSVFAEQAEILWSKNEAEPWEDRLARVYDLLLDNKNMESLLKFELARRLLDLARNTSPGFREILSGPKGFKELMGVGAAVSLRGNWLDPAQNEANESKREEAKKLLAASPRLGPLVADAKTRSENQIAASKRGLTLTGWICRDNEGRPALASFNGAAPTPGGRLFAVAGEWVELGSVSADGKEFLIKDSARPFLGWPIFAIAVPK